MASSASCSAPSFHFRPTEEHRISLASSGLLSSRQFSRDSSTCSKTLLAKAAKSDQNKKVNSVICADCDGNGAVQCSQCKGNGVNAVDVFNGKFKAGDSCWLCGGKNDILCGNCNGAGFIGGFMSTKDE